MPVSTPMPSAGHHHAPNTAALDSPQAADRAGAGGASEPGGPEAKSDADPHVQPRRNGAIRVLVADDHKIVREGLVLTLESFPDVELVGEAENGQQAIEMIRQARPAVVVMDVSMPVLDGIEATRQLSHEHPEIKVIGLSMHDSEEIRHALLNAGAAAYLTKNGAMEELIDAIRRHAD